MGEHTDLQNFYVSLENLSDSLKVPLFILKEWVQEKKAEFRCVGGKNMVNRKWLNENIDSLQEAKQSWLAEAY